MCIFLGVSMKPSSRSGRKAAQLSASINRHLNLYTLTAAAAGIGIMALAQPAQAKIVYTPANEKFPVTLDLNHDGIGDFVLALGDRADSQDVRGFAWAYAPRSNPANEIVATAKGGYEPAVALRGGERIGPGRLFGNGDILVEHLSQFGRGSSYTKWFDQWGNGGKGLKDRYLGLKFMIKGKVHYGWARVPVTTGSKNFTATLTGYAYETIPNKSIIAGKTKGTDDESRASVASPSPVPPTLGMLALGAPGIPLWRRRESLAATQ